MSTKTKTPPMTSHKTRYAVIASAAASAIMAVVSIWGLDLPAEVTAILVALAASGAGGVATHQTQNYRTDM